MDNVLACRNTLESSECFTESLRSLRASKRKLMQKPLIYRAKINLYSRGVKVGTGFA
jgi:hypothetical protein